ncbi:MAG: hypothetical protein HWD82_00030 [Flavobacteriaceae bacterium]|nr:hypothetical protein [Flavobacteriaceae bacterium]
MKTPITELEQLTINNASRNYLSEISKWAFFLSIVGFVGVAFFVLVAIFSGIFFGEEFNSLYENQIPFNMGSFISVTYLVIAAIYFFPILYLFKFSKKMKIALASKNDDSLSGAFEMLKSHYKFLGVFTIIVLSLYALLFIIGMLGFAFV